MSERIRDIFLGFWGRTVTKHPLVTLLICLLIATGSVIVTLDRLEFHGDRGDLIDPELEWNARYNEYRRDFPRWDDLVICLEGEASDERITDLARSLAEQLRESPRVLGADAGFRTNEASPRLFMAAPQAEFEQRLLDIRVGKELSQAANAVTGLEVLMSQLQREGKGSNTIQQLNQIMTPYIAGLEGGDPVFDLVGSEFERWQPLVTESGRIRIIQLRFAPLESAINSLSDNLVWLRQQVSLAVQESGIENIEYGITGIPAIEADETTQSIYDSTIASIIALALITIMMLIAFRGIVIPLLAAGCLLIAIAWSFGWLVFSVGHLQLLSVVFSVILLGLGVDFALHLVSRLELVHRQHTTLHEAVARVFRGIGPGMITGTITTAVAFGATALTDFKGMAEMGIIAGGGIIVCLFAMLSSFPAALALLPNWHQILRHRDHGQSMHLAAGRMNWIDHHPLLTLILSVLVVLCAAIPAYRVKYDPNVLNLQPPGIESVQWEARLVEDDARTVWNALIRTTREKTPELVTELTALPTVHDVGGMGLLYPTNYKQRALEVAKLRNDPIRTRSMPSTFPYLRAQVQKLLFGLQLNIQSVTGWQRTELDAIVSRIQHALLITREVTEEEKQLRAQRTNEAFHTAQIALKELIDEALEEKPLQPNDLPEALRAQWIGTNGDWLLRVYPQADEESILEPARLKAFIEDIRNVAPDVLGPPVQIFESSIIVVGAYQKAAIYALIAILIVLLLDFRSIADALCAMVPVSVGFVGVFGLLGLLQFSVNFANLIVMPLILGIGMAAGVHMVHRWRYEPEGRPAGLSGGTGRAVTMTLLTTMIGFGAMMIAEHRGIRSLGAVMTTGLGMTLLACYTVMPAILQLRNQRRNARSVAKQQDTA